MSTRTTETTGASPGARQRRSSSFRSRNRASSIASSPRCWRPCGSDPALRSSRSGSSRRRLRFPWSVYEFLDVFPERFANPCALAPLKLTANERYDLVILAYQVWYLAPSIPMSSFLQIAGSGTSAGRHPGAHDRGLPKHVVSGARAGQEPRARRQRPPRRSYRADGPGLSSRQRLTILYWMLTGRKDRCSDCFRAPACPMRTSRGAPRTERSSPMRCRRRSFPISRTSSTGVPPAGSCRT